MTFEGVIHPVHEMRYPAGVGFDADYLEIRVALEHSTEDECSDNVLVAADDRHERVDLRSARRARDALIGSQNVEAERHLLFDRRLPEVVVNRTVVVFLDRKPWHHHAAETLRLDPIEVLDAFLGRSHGGLPQPNQ